MATDENGLYYMRARYYNSEIKRFVNQDVLTGTISDSPTMNRYAYVNGNPISLADPFGLSPSLNWLGHAALDVLGLIPGLGVVLDAVNAVWYLAEGDYFSAFCSLIAVIPVVGDAIGLMGKSGKLACSVQKGLHIAANMGSLFKSTYVVGNVIKNNIDRYLINGEEFSWSQLGVDLLTVGLEILAFKSAAKGLVEAENMQVCFVAGTLITTAEGYKAIEEIQAGDEVLAKDVETGEVAVKKVVQTFVNETDELVHVHVNGEEIISTPTHPFYVNQFGWTHAADLRAGDVLVLSNGEYVVVEAIQHEILESPIKVYNFEVEEFHTYFVGESSVLVHNTCPRKNQQVKIYKEYTGHAPTGEVHHGLPEQYSDWFSRRVYVKNQVKIGQNLDINSGEFYFDLPKALHRLKSGHGIHTNSSYAGKTWNKAWKEYISKHPNATAEQVLAHLRELAREFGITPYRAKKG